jgi:hypothetical protein
MSKWRPVKKNAIYVIPDIHGAFDLLKLICDRILPLRKSDGGRDILVLLGDYIDRHIDSPKVIDFCIELKKKYGDQVFCIMGNHEFLVLKTLNIIPGKNYSLQDRAAAYKMWLSNGGNETLFTYMQLKGIQETWSDLPFNRLFDVIPKAHKQFFLSLKKGYEFENFTFVHGGTVPDEPIDKQDMEFLVWDRGLVNWISKVISNGAISNTEVVLPWEKTIICGHSPQHDKKPIVKDNFLMLDCGSPKQLLCVELRSREAYIALPGNNRLVKYKLEETIKKRGPFGRV